MDLGEVRSENKKCHALLHIIVNNIWKFNWNPFINVGGVSRTRKYGRFLDNEEVDNFWLGS